MTHIHIEITPGAIATFASEPTMEETNAIKKVVEHFKSVHPVDDFLDRHSDEIAQPYRSWIRDSSAKAIQGAVINMNHCPGHLRSELLDIIITEAEQRRKRIASEYIERNRASKQKFLTGKNKLWV